MIFIYAFVARHAGGYVIAAARTVSHVENLCPTYPILHTQTRPRSIDRVTVASKGEPKHRYEYEMASQLRNEPNLPSDTSSEIVEHRRNKIEELKGLIGKPECSTTPP